MISNRRWRMWAGLSLVGALAGLMGCMDEGSSPRSPDVAEGAAPAPLAEPQGAGDDEAEGPEGHHGRWARGHHGPERLLRAALQELELTEAQRSAVEGALAALPAMPKGPPGGHGVLAALAEGVRAGKVDPVAVAAKAGAAGGFEEHRAAFAGALQTLHATLTKEQRRALVDAIAARMEEHGPKGKHLGMGKHFGPKGARGHGGPHGAGPLGFMLDRLDLTEAQRDAIDRALEAQRPDGADAEVMKQRHETMRAAMRAHLDAFAADTFDAKAVLTPPDGVDHPGPAKHLRRMAEALAVVVPILQPAQREALAAMLEQGPGPARGR